MKPIVTVITLGVDDLEASLRFYRDGLGFPTEGIVGREFEHGAVVFIPLQQGLRLALWPRTSIAHDTGRDVGPRSATESTLGHNVSSKGAVDSVMARAEKAGAVIVKPARETPLTTLRVAEPAKRVAGIKVADVAELVAKLKNEAKVI